MAYKQHFVEWFSGKERLTPWSFRTITNSASEGMSNEIDGGWYCQADSSNTSHSKIDFNNIRPFSPYGSSVNFIHRVSAINAGIIWFAGFGYEKTQNEWSQVNHQAVCFTDSDNSVYKLRTENASSNTDTATTTSVDLLPHSENVVCKTSSVDLSMDGVLGTTNTTNTPTERLQPIFVAASRSGAVRHHVIFCEAYNT